jgi:hypothetical protein
LKAYLSCEAWSKKFSNAYRYSKYSVHSQKFACP